jgi:excisionase family DNA binding protein
VYTVKAIAAELLVSEKTVRRMVSQNQIGYHRVRGRILFSSEQVKTYLESVAVEPRNKTLEQYLGI